MLGLNRSKRFLLTLSRVSKRNHPINNSSIALSHFSTTPSDGLPNGGIGANQTGELSENLPSLVTDTAVADTASVVAEALPDCNFVVAKVMAALDSVHTLAGIPYWEAIVVSTVILRVALLPVAVKTVQGAARMATMRPEMEKIQKRMSEDANANELHIKSKYEQEVRGLFVKHKVNPLRALLWPFVQFPVFIASFMALKDMGVYYPDFSTGGAWWFTDLSAPDAMYILPVFNALSFLAMIELGGDGVKMEQQKTFKMAMRLLAVAMVPLTASMPQGVFVYWATNNTLSITQTAILKNQSVKKFLDIPEPPAEAPDFKMGFNPIKSLGEALEKEKTVDIHAKAEILDVKNTTTNSVQQQNVFSIPPRQRKQKNVDN